MIIGSPPATTDIVRLWIYCISGVVTVIILMVMVCYLACRQEWRDMKARKEARANQYARLQEWQEQVRSFPDLSNRPASDILVELGIGQHQPQTHSQPISSTN